MSKDKGKDVKGLDDKNKETKNLFDNLQQYKKTNKKNIEIDTEGDDKSIEDSQAKDSSDTNNIYLSLLEKNTGKEEYLAATHYFRQDQLKDLNSFSKKSKKGKNEFMRELLDLVFAELKEGLGTNKEKIKTSTVSDSSKKDITSKSVANDSKRSPSGSPFGSLLEVNESKEEYMRATHYFRQDQLRDLDMFVEESGKSKNEFVRDTIDLVFSELKKVNS